MAPTPPTRCGPMRRCRRCPTKRSRPTRSPAGPRCRTVSSRTRRRPSRRVSRTVTPARSTNGEAMSAYSDRVIADGAIAYWRLGETSGTTAVDVVGGKNGTISGGVTLNQGGALVDGDRALGFDGSTSYIDMGDVNALEFPNGAFTLELWTKYTSDANSRVLIGKSAWTTSTQGWTLFQQATVGLRLYVVNAASATICDVTLAGVPQDNQWHHVVVTV